VSECDADSTEIIQSSIADDIVYTINGQVPSFQIDAFQTDNDVCGIKSYGIYQNVGDTEVHSEFNNEVTIEGDKLTL